MLLSALPKFGFSYLYRSEQSCWLIAEYSLKTSNFLKDIEDMLQWILLLFFSAFTQAWFQCHAKPLTQLVLVILANSTIFSQCSFPTASWVDFSSFLLFFSCSPVWNKFCVYTVYHVDTLTPSSTEWADNLKPHRQLCLFIVHWGVLGSGKGISVYI